MMKLSMLLAVVFVPALSSTATAQLTERPNAREALEGVIAKKDIPYVENGHERQVLDLFVPEDANEPLPVMIWVHGGGWQNGSKDGCPPLRKGYVKKGYAVASINYRLSGHATFPAQIEDCKAAIRWLRAHAEENHLDPDQFGVWGSSAGGHLVALVGTSGDVQEFDVGENLDQSSRVQAVCDFYGPTDFKVFVTTPGYLGHAAPGSPESKLVGGLVLENQKIVDKINPITFVTKDDPPFLIVHGTADPTVPLNQSELLFEALQNSEVESKFEPILDAKHGGPEFSSPVIERIVEEFFARHLLKQ